MFIVVAAFELDPADQDRFLALARDDAANSLAREPGCHQFDVCVEPERDGSILFYEVYDDLEAFEEHKRTEHFKVFDEGSRPLIRRSEVRFFERTYPASSDSSTGRAVLNGTLSP